MALRQKAAAVRRAHPQAAPVAHQQARPGQDRTVPQLLPRQRQPRRQEHAAHEMAPGVGAGSAALGGGVPAAAARQHHRPLDRPVRLVRPEHLRVHAPGALVLRGGDVEPGEAQLHVRRGHQQPDAGGPLHAAGVGRLAPGRLRLPQVPSGRRQEQAVLRLRLQLLPHGQPRGPPGPAVRARRALRRLPEALQEGAVHQRLPRGRPVGQLPRAARVLAALAVPYQHAAGPPEDLLLQGHLQVPEQDHLASWRRFEGHGDTAGSGSRAANPSSTSCSLVPSKGRHKLVPEDGFKSRKSEKNENIILFFLLGSRYSSQLWKHGGHLTFRGLSLNMLLLRRLLFTNV